MRRKVLISVVYANLVIMAGFISGCTGNRVDLVGSNVLTIEKYSSGKVYIPWCEAYKDNDGFIVNGVLKRSDSVGLAIKTHVHVVVLSPERTVLDEAKSSDIYVPRRAVGKYKSPKRFKINFDESPPRGSLVRVTACSDLHDNESWSVKTTLVTSSGFQSNVVDWMLCWTTPCFNSNQKVEAYLNSISIFIGYVSG
jgi:hypothetical protein